ncbi:MAG TPA: metallophosphoesterase [Chthonomonadales bacterium]|nr:metallophosphoesterase [Chthonomonadales bacterium]
MQHLTRRQILATGIGAAAAAVAPAAAASSGARPAPQRVLRIAHLADTHVQPERGAAEGFEACLNAVQAMPDRPDLVITGGDLIMSSFAATKERTKTQWDLFTRVLRASLSLPVEHTIGNHDVWGWANPEQYAQDPLYGKKWACEVLGLEGPYRSLVRAGWRMIFLDGTFPRPGHARAYVARLDDAQFAWLGEELRRTPAEQPVLISSHMPILAACAFFDGDNEVSGDWQVPGAWMHIDARRIKDLFLQHPNVKVCISGHIHLVDKVVYNNVTYFCNGAVSGAWWRGNYQEFGNGYGVLDLFADGSCANRYVTYPWQVRP